MSVARRPHLDDRRRLVIYSQRMSQQPVEGQGRPKAGDSRQAGGKSKTAGYNSRVHRRLRARWYGLVPVRRRTMLACGGALGLVVLVLAVAHWAAFWWSPLAMRPALARPLRLDRPDSFGTWLSALLLAVTAGASLLVYQLRRHRADDYHGHYRLWRISILVCMLASVDCVTHLVSWLGGGLDVLLAEREVLAGADWVRLLLVVGGAAFGIRMTAEVARDRSAAVCMMLSLGLYALPIAARWNFFRLEPAAAATWLPIVLLVARGMMLLAVVSYLRMLYRQVRRLEHQQTVKAALLGWLPQRTARQPEPELVEQRAETAKRRRRKTEPTNRSVAAAEVTPKKSAKPLAVVSSADEVAEEPDGDQDSQAEAELETGAAKGRFRFGWKRRRAAAEDAGEDNADGDQQADAETADANSENSASEDAGDRPSKRRFGFGLGRRRAAAEDAGEDNADGDEQADAETADENSENSASDDAGDRPSKRRFGFGLGRRRAAAEDAAEDNADGEQQADAETADENSADGDAGDRPSKRRFGFGLGRRRAAAGDAAEDNADGEQQADAETADANSADDDAGDRPAKRRFGFGLGRRRAAAEDAAEDNADGDEQADAETADANSADDDAGDRPAKRRFGFGLGRRRAAAEDADATAEEERDVQQQPVGRSDASAPASRTQQSANAGTAARTGAPDHESSGDEDEEDLDPDGIDWESLNKSERRRMRKLLKRQGKAA